MLYGGAVSSGVHQHACAAGIWWFPHDSSGLHFITSQSQQQHTCGLTHCAGVGPSAHYSTNLFAAMPVLPDVWSGAGHFPG